MIVRLDKYAVKDAVEALTINHQNALKVPNVQNKLVHDDFIYQDIILTKKQPKVTIKPIQIPLKNTIYTYKKNTNICLIVRSKKFLTEDQTTYLTSKNIEVQQLDDANEKYFKNNQIVDFMRKYALILVEDRIYENVRKNNYREFIKKKRLPFPINVEEITNKDNQNKLDEILQSVILCKTQGPLHSIHVFFYYY